MQEKTSNGAPKARSLNLPKVASVAAAVTALLVSSSGSGNVSIQSIIDQAVTTAASSTVNQPELPSPLVLAQSQQDITPSAQHGSHGSHGSHSSHSSHSSHYSCSV